MAGEEEDEVELRGGLRQLWLGLEPVPCVVNTWTEREEERGRGGEGEREGGRV